MAIGFLQRDFIDGLLQRKYDIAQQQADADTNRAGAAVMGAQTDQARMPWQNFLDKAQGGLLGQQANEFAANSAAARTLDYANADQSLASASASRDQIRAAPDDFLRAYGEARGLRAEERPMPYGMRSLSRSPSVEELERSNRFIGWNAKGLTRVPGKGSGKKDTKVSAVAPGEAILNKAAADMLGRGLISTLNQKGARKMGMV